MRFATPAQIAALTSKYYKLGLKVLIADGDGTLQDWTVRGGTNWSQGLTIDHNIDQPISQCTLLMRRESGATKSLAPFRTDSTLNRNALNAYSPAIDAGRLIVVRIATVAISAAIVDADYIELFRGYVDRITWNTSVVQIVCRDIAGILADASTRDDANYGTGGGTPLESVMQSIMDAGGTGLTLAVPVSPGFGVTPYTQQVQVVADALKALAGLIGWDFRALWNQPTLTWQLTLIDPSRTKTVPDLIVGSSRYIDVTDLKIDRDKIRNAIDGWYTDSATKALTKLSVTDGGSEFKYGVRWMGLREASNSPINTGAKMLAMLNAALSDLKDPKAEQEIDMHVDWRIEINDLLQFTANGVHYDTDQKGAVVQLQHKIAVSTMGAVTARSVVRTRGNPCGQYLGWTERSWIPVTTDPGPSLLVNVTRGDDADSIAWSGDGVSLAIDGVTSALPASPFTIVHGVSDHVYVFTATANLQTTSETIYIPSGFKTGPELSYSVADNGALNVTITGRRGATKTYLFYRADQRPPVSDILDAAKYTLFPGRSGDVASLIVIGMNTNGWIGAISENASGTRSDPVYRQVPWFGVGATPVPRVTASAAIVQDRLLTWNITLSASVVRVEAYRAYNAADPSPGSPNGVDLESLASEVWDFWDITEPGIAAGVPFPVKLPLPNNTYYGLLTLIPIDALGQRGQSLNLKAQGPGATLPTTPGKPSLAAGTPTSTTLPAAATLASSGAAVVDLRQYADGKIIARTGTSVGPNGTQPLVYSPFDPQTVHELRVSGVTAGGIEGPLSDPITMTTAAAATSGGGTSTNGKCPTPALFGATYSIPDQGAVIQFSLAAGAPPGVAVVFEGSADGVTGWYTVNPSGATASPVVAYQPQQPGADSTVYYRAHATAGAPYTDSDLSNVVSVTAPQGSGLIY